MRSRDRSRILALAASIAAVGAAALFVRREPPAAFAREPSVPAAEIALAATRHDPDARSTEVRFARVDAHGLSAHVAGAIPHARGAVVRGDVLAGARAAVVAADREDASDRDDYATDLWRVDDGGAPRLLARGLYHASRPLASRDGMVYVERGASGAWPTAEEARAGRLRVDAIRIDAIDPANGQARRLYDWSGYTVHLAGETAREIVAYRVGPGGAEVVGIDRSTGASRLVASVPPFARDFSIDDARGALVMSNRDEHDAHLWVIERLDLASGVRTRLAEEQGESPAPFALPSGELASTAHARAGLAIGARGLAPLGEGFDAVTRASADGAWAAVLHVAPNRWDEAYALHLASATPVRLASGDERIEVLGFVR